MNQQGPSTPQRINAYPVGQQPGGVVVVGQPMQQQQQQQQMINRPLQQNPNTAPVFNNVSLTKKSISTSYRVKILIFDIKLILKRSFSPHTPSSQPQSQIARTPIQLMQQQTQAISGNPQLNSPIAAGQMMSQQQTNDSMRKRQQHHMSASAQASPHSGANSTMIMTGAVAGAVASSQQNQMDMMARTQNRIMYIYIYTHREREIDRH